MRVKKVTFASRKAHVYDIETPCHNYLLEGGIISHNTMDLYPQQVISGGTGILYSANIAFIIGRRKVTGATNKDIQGYDFILRAVKHRMVKEDSYIPIEVRYDGGISIYSGLLDIAKDLGFVSCPTQGWYARSLVNEETGELQVEDKKWRRSETDTSAFWDSILHNPAFDEAVKKAYQLPENELVRTA